ncbi:MAG: biosynthetic peptidoglycan transglycosylase, partial [Polyangiaceae bacterium]
LLPLIGRHVEEGADVGVNTVIWRISRPSDSVALTLGPGPASLTRSSSNIDLRFSTDSKIANSPLEVGLVLALDGRGDTLTIQGGPISLAQLGLEEGAAGLVDVAHATMTGRARVGLADDGSTITFDARAVALGLSLYNPKLAPEVIRGMDVSLRARGAAAASGEVRLDDLAAEFGAVRVSAGGILNQEAKRVVGTFHFDLPSASCESLLDSIPGALVPALGGATMSGTFGAHGRFGFDTRALDDITLDYDIEDHCQMIGVPPPLARERFLQPFDHPIYLPDGSVQSETTGPGSTNWTPLDEISPYMQVAVMTTEDGAFRKHHGFNRASIRASIIANLKARRFVRGASTITMQLAKNLFLSRDKTLARKLEEVILTDYIEQTFSKDEIMELYLNVIEFGPGVYGITAAADYYFGRTPGELNLAESLLLSSLLPSPLRYGAMRDDGEVPQGWMRTLHALMQIAHRNKRITDAELAEGEEEHVVFWHGGERPTPRPPIQARPYLDSDTDDVTTTPTGDLPRTP